jgi:error-prone DNA polymerase
MTETEVVQADAWATGVTPDSYPTQYVRDGLRAAGVITVAEVVATESGRRVAAGGVVPHRQRPGTAGGVTFRSAPALGVRGRGESADGAVNLLAEHLAPLHLTTVAKSRDFR